MAKKGTKIPDLTKDRVRKQLADETNLKAIKRLTAAREYLEGLFVDLKLDRQIRHAWLPAIVGKA